ncbi:MAG: type VI secretion system-associated protein TagO [Pseudomonadota bacterium]
MRSFAIFAVFTLFSTPGAAAPEDCIPIQAFMERLACYDREVGRSDVIEKPAPTTNSTQTNWRVRTNKSEMTDFENVYVSTISKGAAQCRRFGSPVFIELNLRCQENTTTLMVGANDCHLASGFQGYGRVEIRVDDGPVSTVNMEESTNNAVLGLWSGSGSIPQIKKMIGSEEVTIRFTPFNVSPVTVKFDTTGLDQAITPLRDACGW